MTQLERKDFAWQEEVGRTPGYPLYNPATESMAKLRCV